MLSLGTLTLILLWMFFYTHITLSESIAFEPAFDAPMANITVKEGDTAILPCSVTFLGDYQVVWTDQWSTLLTFEDRRIIDDRRLSIERSYTKDWNLHMRDVKRNDQGTYNCQVNTTPVKIKTVYLMVDVPAKILRKHSTEDMTVKEGETINLQCNVSGIPMPNVTWTRYHLKNDAKKRIDFCSGTYNFGYHKESLMIQNASRDCWGIYRCTAFNGVPPEDTVEIGVTVEFPPEVKLPNDRIGQYREKETILECVVTANPQGISEWTRHGIKIDNSPKYRLDIYRDEDYTITLSLRIRYLEEDDFGAYICVATNVRGSSQQIMTLYDYAEYRSKVETPLSTTTSTMATYKTDWVSIQRRQYPIYDNRTGSIFVIGSGRHRANNNGHRTRGVSETKDRMTSHGSTTSVIGGVHICLIIFIVRFHVF